MCRFTHVSGGEYGANDVKRKVDAFANTGATTLEEAYVQAALGMFGYLTEPESVDVDPSCSRIIEAAGHDHASLLFNFLDACLYAFASDDFIAKDMRAFELHLPLSFVSEGEKSAAGAPPVVSAAPTFRLRALA
jgi:SHS2 domain-containing protein